MGYNFIIGNAVLEEIDPDNPGRPPRVENAEHPDAPAFGEPTDHTNERWPSYTAWRDFCKEVGLVDLFYNKNSGLIAQHPGACELTQVHLDEIARALEHRRASNGDKEPGFEDETPEGELIDTGKDAQLARLVWLEYWVRWALRNCEHPIFRNS
jgi:hypothetical protein